MAITKIEATIASGASLSDDVEITGALVGIITPSAWTTAAMTFQAAYGPDDTFADVYDGALGTAAERTIASGNIPTAARRYLALSLNDWLGIQRLKIRSGTTGAAVNQSAQRKIILLLAR